MATRAERVAARPNAASDPIIDGIILVIVFFHLIATLATKIFFSFRPTPNASIFNAIKNQDWTRATRLLVDPRHEHHARYTYTNSNNATEHLMGGGSAHERRPQWNGYTSLHRACQTSDATPLSVIRLLLRAFPGAVMVTDSKGRTPLHYAARFDREVVVKEVLEAYPAAVSLLDNKGRSPLGTAVRKCCRREIVTLLARGDPSMINVVDKGSAPSPLQTFLGQCRDWKLSGRSAEDVNYLACMFLTAGGVSDDVGRRGRLRQAKLKIRDCLGMEGFPPPLFHILLQNHPEQAWVEDGNGALLVHSVVSKRDYDYENYTRMMNSLLTINPSAASIPDPHNRLSLAIMAERGYGDHKRMFLSAPEAVRTRDVKTHLVPFMAAAVKSAVVANQTLRQFNTVFDLLMKDPIIVSFGIPQTEPVMK